MNLFGDNNEPPAGERSRVSKKKRQAVSSLKRAAPLPTTSDRANNSLSQRIQKTNAQADIRVTSNFSEQDAADVAKCLMKLASDIAAREQRLKALLARAAAEGNLDLVRETLENWLGEPPAP